MFFVLFFIIVVIIFAPAFVGTSIIDLFFNIENKSVLWLITLFLFFLIFSILLKRTFYNFKRALSLYFYGSLLIIVSLAIVSPFLPEDIFYKITLNKFFNLSGLSWGLR